MSEEADPLKHVMIFSIATNLRCNLPHFVECVNNDLTTGQGMGEVLVYIHGYNTSHLKAVKQALQLKNDLDFKGTIILYNWSTKGTILGYDANEETTKENFGSLHELFKSIMKEVNILNICNRFVNIMPSSLNRNALYMRPL